MKAKTVIKFVVGMVVIGGGMVYFMVQAMQSSWSYYYSVDEFLSDSEQVQSSSLRLAGKVKVGSVERDLEELKLDYEDFLRQRGLLIWQKDEPLRQKLIDRRCRTADEVAAWIMKISRRCGQSGQDEHDTGNSTVSTKSTMSTVVFPELSANAALVLLAVACSLLDRQVARLADDFEQGGGFTERLYRVRKQNRGY